jgi:hypothetical protein
MIFQFQMGWTTATELVWSTISLTEENSCQNVWARDDSWYSLIISNYFHWLFYHTDKLLSNVMQTTIQVNQREKINIFHLCFSPPSTPFLEVILIMNHCFSVLPAFSGNVPAALKSIFPSAKITRLGNW